MSEALESAIARIYNQEGGIVGTGFLVSEQYLLTCAHVVADALGLDRYTVEKPQEPVSLDFPYLGVAGVTGQVMEWKPRAETETSEGDDIALLQLESPVRGQQTRLVWTANISGDRYRASGFPRGYDSSVSSYGIVRDRLPNGRWQIEDETETGIAIQGGFSGCPVWDERAKGIIGMVVEEADAKVAFMIPTEVLVKACPVLDEWVLPYPFMAEDLPENFVQRPREFEPLVTYLLERERNRPVAITAALKGAGGYGKTILARAICHDRRIRKAFRDGIFWVTLGEKPDVAGGLTKLYQKLTDSTRTFVDGEQAAGELAQQWENKHCLVVVDDVWNEAHLRPFLRGGERCTRLVTTRNSDTLPPHTQNVDVDAMQSTEAVELLGYDLPKEQQEEFRELAARLGEWPLLLKLVNGALREQIELGSNLDESLDFVNEGLTEEGLTAFDSEDAVERNQAVTKTLNVSLKLLEKNQLSRYRELAIFPEDVDIPLATLEKLWGATGKLKLFRVKKLCLRLFRLSLLLAYDVSEQTIRLHDVVRQYLQQETELVTVHNQFLDAYSQTLPPVSPSPRLPVTNWWELPTDEPYLWQYLAYHLTEAGREEELEALLLNFDWLQAKLNATDIYSLIADYDFLSDNTNLRLVQEALRLSSHVLVEDKTQLASQLWGRLLSFDVPEIQTLLNQTLQSISPLSPLSPLFPLSLPWLRPTTPSLTPPGGRLIRTLTGHSSWVNAVAITPDGKRAISGSYDRTLKV